MSAILLPCAALADETHAESGASFGMGGAVGEIADHPSSSVRDTEAEKLYEGREAYESGDYTRAVSLFDKALPSLDRQGQDEATYLMARSYMALQRPADAARLLGKVTEGGFWAAYGYYNLAIYYGTSDSDLDRSLIAFRVAAAMTPDTQEGLELKDRIYLSAGHVSLLAHQYDKTVGFLQNVRADSASTAAGIYDYGLAFAGLNRYRVAIQAWHGAKKFALVVPGVAESFQAIGYGYEQEGLRAAAIDAYLEAVSIYDKEMRHTEEVRQSLLKDGMLAALDKARRHHNKADWFLATDLVASTRTVTFVNFLMSDDEFYSSAKSLLQLDSLRKSARRALEELEIYSGSLNSRSASIAAADTQRKDLLRTRNLNTIIARRNELAPQLRTASISLVAELEYIDSLLLRARQKFVQLRKQLDAAESGYSELQARITSLRGRYSSALQRTDAAIAAHEKRLATLGGKLLSQYHDEIEELYLQSQISLVKLYDDLAAERLQSGAAQ